MKTLVEDAKVDYVVPSDLVIYDIPNFNCTNHSFLPIDKNQFEDDQVKAELLSEFDRRASEIQKLKDQGDPKWTCNCINSSVVIRNKFRNGIICTEMTCRNLGANWTCPPDCGQENGVICWNQHFPHPLVTFGCPAGLILFESEHTGLGVMTTKGMKQGSISGEFVGVVSRGCTGTDDDIYAAQVAELPYHITPIQRGNYTRFFNHCGVEPNHDALCFITCSGPRILMVASKDISPGQECTWHYGEYWHNSFMELGGGKCLCKNCVDKKNKGMTE